MDNFNEIRIFTNQSNDLDIMNEIIDLKNEEDAFQILNLADIVKNINYGFSIYPELLLIMVKKFY